MSRDITILAILLWPLLLTPSMAVGYDAIGKIAFYSNRGGRDDICIMNANGSDVQLVTKGEYGGKCPDLSPYGSQIVFVSLRDGNSELYMIDFATGAQGRLTDLPSTERQPKWSPDGRRIAFQSDRDGNYEIYTMDADGTNWQRLTFSDAEELWPKWSPDGHRIVFNSFRDENWEIYIVNSDGTDLRRLTNTLDVNETGGAWSPDGKHIAFRSGPPRQFQGNIHIIDVDGTDETELTDFDGVEENPIWSPDGKQIAFQTMKDGNFEIYVMDADGSNLRNLTNHPANDYWPSWVSSSADQTSPPRAPNTSNDRIEPEVDEIFSECNKPGSPGAAVVVLKDGQIVLSKGYGTANLEHDIPITTTTVFWVASLSKQFTAMAITMLEKQGKLSIDDEIHKYLPELPDFGARITVRHLLHHMSGLRDDLTMWLLAGNHIEDIITERDLLTLIRCQKQLNFSPGSKYGYSDANYILLAEIASRVTGDSFANWVERNILLPLEMTSSRFVVNEAEPVKNRAYCYKKNSAGDFRNVLLNMNYAGPTGLLTTAEDMAKWVLNFESGKIGGDSVLEAMLTQGVLDDGDQIKYARGLTVDRYNGRKLIRHSGTDAGFNSHMSYFPDERLGVVVLSNFESNPWDMATKVADLFLPVSDESADEELEESPSESRSEPVAVKLTDDQLAACAGTYWYSDSWNWLVRCIIVEDNAIYYVRSDDDRSELIPVSENEFLLASNDKLVVRFSRLENGHFTDLTFDATSQQPSHAVRVEHLEPTKKDLSEYEGLYYAEELDALHRLVVSGGEVFNVKFRYDPDTPWTWVVKDRFTFMDGDGHVTFRRDARDQVIGYVIDFPRVLNIFFEKLR